MNKKIIITIIIFLFFLLIGILFYNYTHREIIGQDNISFVLNMVKDETGINFSEISDVEFEWIVSDNGQIVHVPLNGKGMKNENITTEQGNKIEDFFKENDFIMDLYNVADGPTGGIVGYRKNKMYCVIEKEYVLDSESYVTNISVEVNCAL